MTAEPPIVTYQEGRLANERGGMAGTKRRTTQIRLTEPETVPMSAEDYRQAVSALASMIHQWWLHTGRHAGPGTEPGPVQPDPTR